MVAEEEEKEEAEEEAEEEEEEEEVKDATGVVQVKVVKKVRQLADNAPKKMLNDQEAEQAIAEFMERVSLLFPNFLEQSPLQRPKPPRLFPVTYKKSPMPAHPGRTRDLKHPDHQRIRQGQDLFSEPGPLPGHL